MVWFGIELFDKDIHTDSFGIAFEEDITWSFTSMEKYNGKAVEVDINRGKFYIEIATTRNYIGELESVWSEEIDFLDIPEVRENLLKQLENKK